MTVTPESERTERVLTFLQLLDDDAIEHTLRGMDAETAEQLREMLTGRRRPSNKNLRRALDEFESLFQFAMKYAPPDLKIHEPSEARDDEQEQIFEATGNAIADLERMNVHQVTGALEEETPRTTAILMKELSATRNAEILSLMSAEQRDSVVRELSQNPAAPRIMVLQIAASAVQRAATLPAERSDDPNPIERIANVLRETDKGKRREIVNMMQEHDKETMDEIGKLLYQIEDLVKMDDHVVRSVLEKVETSTISTAMYGVDPAVSERILSNLSKRARMTLEEELAFQGHVAESVLKNARAQVSEAIAEAEMEAG